jgi:AraC-like DNA-binding protein
MRVAQPDGFVTHRVAGALGDWTAVEWRPPHLRGVVERLWHFSGRVAHPRERVLPTGRLQLIVHLDERYGVVGPHGVERCAPLVLSGHYTRPYVIEAPAAPATVLGIELTPEGAWRVLRRPLHVLAGVDVDLRDLVGAAPGSELGAHCAAASEAGGRLQAAAAWIEARLHGAGDVEAPIAWIAGRIRARRGNVAIGALREAAGLTASALVTRFREQIGVTPKVYARLHRFQHAAERLRQGESPLDVALAAGYYDQPHLSAEFRELSGLTPASFAATPGYQTGVNVPEGSARDSA